MISGAMIAEIAALAGDPARANILSALLDGRAMTATELAFAAHVTPQTASAHLAKLTEAGLINATPSGRHRYFRLTSAKVAQMLESIGAVAIDSRPRFRPLSRQAAALRDARVCYDHLAGRLGVAIADAMIRRGYIVLEDEGGHFTDAGIALSLGPRHRSLRPGAAAPPPYVPRLPRLDRAAAAYRRRDRRGASRAMAGAGLDRRAPRTAAPLPSLRPANAASATASA